ENRWGLRVASAAEVEAAHQAAMAQQQDWEIRQVLPLARDARGASSFALQDLDGNWWEIYHRPGQLYDALFDDMGTSGTKALAQWNLD
ncbi:MAG: hypothetical protein ACREFQ_06280, partial [Stellaceae bacterium]